MFQNKSKREPMYSFERMKSCFFTANFVIYSCYLSLLLLAEEKTAQGQQKFNLYSSPVTISYDSNCDPLKPYHFYLLML